MAFCSNCWLLRDGLFFGLATGTRMDLRTGFVKTSGSGSTNRKKKRQTIRCAEKETKWKSTFDPEKIEPPPYSLYRDSITGELAPADGHRASIPGQDYWPEGTASQVRAAQAPPPQGTSEGSPSFGKKPGSRRSKRYNTNAKESDSEMSSEPVGSREENEITKIPLEDSDATEITKMPWQRSEESEINQMPWQSSEGSEITEMPLGMESAGGGKGGGGGGGGGGEGGGAGGGGGGAGGGEDEYVVYDQNEENLSGYALDRRMGNPHPFIDPALPEIQGTIPNDDLWWNWRKEERWSRWQRRRPDVETVFTKAMAETGQIKIFGDEPSIAECNITRARKNVFKEERLKAEQVRLEEIGPVAYYSEWVSAYEDMDTSREAIQQLYEETGEDEYDQLIEMFAHQTAAEYRVMVGTDNRIQRDPLSMRMREDLIKQIFGGDPVYPTVNYIRDPDEVIDYRSQGFHEPIPDIVPNLLASGMMIPAYDFEKMMDEGSGYEKEPGEVEETFDAVDIGEMEMEDEDDLEDNEGEGRGEKLVLMQNVQDIGEEDFEDSDGEGEGEGEGREVVDKIQNIGDMEDPEDSEGEGREVGKIKNIKGNEDNWSLIKTSSHIQKSKEKPKKGVMSLKDAIKDSENLTDFLMDFEGDEED